MLFIEPCSVGGYVDLLIDNQITIYSNKALIINNTKSRKHKLFKKVNGANGIASRENYYECCYHDIKVLCVTSSLYV